MTREDIREYLPYDPSVFVMGEDYQIIFITKTAGIGMIEIDGERFVNEECGILVHDTVHKICVPGKKLNLAKHYTLVFVEYADKKPYFPEGREVVRRKFDFHPLGDDFRLIQFADTHGLITTPLELYENVGECDIILLNGDMNIYSDTENRFHNALHIAGKCGRGERPVIFSRGNHDTRGAAAQLQTKYIPTRFEGGRRETFYTFRQGSLWGLVLDCGEDKCDAHPEYGGTVSFDTFRRRETEYLERLAENGEIEFNAPGVKHRIAFCHIPFVEHFEEPFNIAEDIYERWIELLGKMGIELLLCGHRHKTYYLELGTEACRFARFPTMISSIPYSNYPDGREYYTGALIEVKDGHRYVMTIPHGEKIEF